MLTPPCVGCPCASERLERRVHVGRYSVHTAFSVEAPEGAAEADLGAIDALDVDADWSAREVPVADIVGWLDAHSQARRDVCLTQRHRLAIC